MQCTVDIAHPAAYFTSYSAAQPPDLSVYASCAGEAPYELSTALPLARTIKCIDSKWSKYGVDASAQF